MVIVHSMLEWSWKDPPFLMSENSLFDWAMFNGLFEWRIGTLVIWRTIWCGKPHDISSHDWKNAMAGCRLCSWLNIFNSPMDWDFCRSLPSLKGKQIPWQMPQALCWPGTRALPGLWPGSRGSRLLQLCAVPVRWTYVDISMIYHDIQWYRAL